MMEAISEIVGTADLGQQGRAAVYRALRTLMCSSCERVITEGELFTRHSVTKGGLKILPKCQHCLPFKLEAEITSRSPLIQSLLSPDTSPTSKKASDNAGKAEQRARIAEAVRQRLGPALARSRRKRG